MFVGRNAWDSALLSGSNGSWVQGFGGSSLLAGKAADGLFTQHSAYDFSPTRNLADTIQAGRPYDNAVPPVFFRNPNYTPIQPTQLASDPGTLPVTMAPKTGGNSLRWTLSPLANSNGTYADLAFLPVVAGQYYTLTFTVATTDTTNTAFTVFETSFDKSLKFLGDDSTSSGWTVGNNVWQTVTLTVIPQGPWSHVSILASNANSTGNALQYFWIDNVTMVPAGQVINGTAFPPPTTPTNTQFFRTDRGTYYYFNGTTWNPISPAWSMFSATLAATFTTTTNAFVQVPYSATEFDLHTDFTTGASAHFTCPEAGYYSFSANCALTPVADGNSTLASFFKNGSRTKDGLGVSVGAAAGSTQATGSCLMKLALNDTVDYRVFVTTGQAGGGGSPSTANNYFSGFRVA